jgi:DNA-binding NtrC family response regulator
MSNELILVVDDEPEIGDIVTRVLQRDKYRVLTASSATEALRIIGEQKAPIDLVITDLVMPGIGGRELVWRLQELCPGVCVILLSGYADVDGALQMMDNVPSVFLQKPVDLELLSTTVRELLDQRAC